MYSKRQQTQQQQQRQPPSPPLLPPPPTDSVEVVGIAPAPWRRTTTSGVISNNMEELCITENHNNHYYYKQQQQQQQQQQQHHQYHQQQQQQQQQYPPPPPASTRQNQTLYVYLSGLLQRIGQASSPVERYRSLQELYAILSSPSQESPSEADARVEMLLNHHGDAVLCWQLAYAATQTQHHAGRGGQGRGGRTGGKADVAVLALLLECLALIWTPKSSTTTTAASSLPRRLGLDSRVQSMKQAAHTTLPILLQIGGDDFPHDTRIQKPLLFILRLYTKIRDVPTKSMLIKSGLVVHLRQALERLLVGVDVQNQQQQQQHMQGQQHQAVLRDENESLVPCILGLMKDLLFRAESTEKQYMYEEWQAVVLGDPYRSYMATTVHHASDDGVACAEALSACLWNWAVSDELARRMAQQPAVWEMLHDLLTPTSVTCDDDQQQQQQQQQQPEPETPHLLASPREDDSEDELFANVDNIGGSSSGNNNNAAAAAWAHVHRNALAALGTMIASCTVTTRSLNQKNDSSVTAVLQEQTWLIPCLSSILDQHEDKDTRRRCMRTLRCLSSCSWGRDFLVRPPAAAAAAAGGGAQTQNSSTTAIISLEQQQNHNKLLTLFLRCLQRQDEDVDTRIQASLAMAALLPSCHATTWMTLGPYFETALVQTIENATTTTTTAESSSSSSSSSSHDKLVLTATQALQVSLDHNPWKRGGSGCFSVQFFGSTLRVLRNQMSEPTYHSTFASLILHVVNGKNAIRTTTKSSSTILICAPVAELLSTLLTPLGPNFEASRSDALQAIFDLTATANDMEPRDEDSKNDHETNYRKNLKTLAANEGLLNNLVNLCLIAPEFKDQAKSAILKLVPEL